MSDDKPSIVEALTAVMDDVREVRKTGRNESQGFSFRGIDAVTNAVGPALREHHVIVMPTVNEARYSDVEVGRNRTKMRCCTIDVTYTFHGPEGDSLAARVWGEALDAGDKATAKAHSVAMRTALLQALCIPTDEPDPDSQTYERSVADDNEPPAEPPPAPVEPGEGWETRAEQEAVWARLVQETKDSGPDGAVAAWLKDEHMTLGKFTAAVAAEWSRKLYPPGSMVPLLPGEEPF